MKIDWTRGLPRLIMVLTFCTIFLVIFSAIVLSCAPGEVTSTGEEPTDWHSMGKSTYYKVIKPFSSSASPEGCIVVRTNNASGSSISISVDCYGR